jgi:hypothetical protein
VTLTKAKNSIERKIAIRTLVRPINLYVLHSFAARVWREKLMASRFA